MSLQGTLETIALTDVLSLLAATRKTGELRVGGGRGDGRLWLDGGKVVSADVPRAATPVGAVFELLRLTAGSFTFDDGTAAPAPGGEPLAVDALLAESQARLDAWRAIEAVVPSLGCTVALAPELDSDDVTVSRQQWKQLVAVAAAEDVNGVMARLGLGEFDASRTIKDLVDAGLVTVGPAPADKPEPAPTAKPPSSSPVAHSGSPSRPAAPPPTREEADELVHQLASLSKGTPANPAAPKGDTAAPVSSAVGPGPAADAGADEARVTGEGHEDEPINRGMLLKFLSSVRP